MMWLVKITRKDTNQVQYGNLPNCSYSEAQHFIEQAKQSDPNLDSAILQLPSGDGSGKWLELVEVEGVVV